MVANTAPFTVPARRPRYRTGPHTRWTVSRAALPRLRTLRQWERWIGLGLAGGGVVMVPWMFVLARTLPSSTQVSHWSTAWIGLDALMAAGLLGTGVLLARRDPRHGLTAAATGALLAMDAWFDVLTSAPGADRALAVALAAGLELPIACACAALAVRSLRPITPAHPLPPDTERALPPDTALTLPTDTEHAQPADAKRGLPADTECTLPAGAALTLSADTKRGLPAATERTLAADTEHALPTGTDHAQPAATERVLPPDTALSLPTGADPGLPTGADLGLSAGVGEVRSAAVHA
ncbi:hypothetical protein [Actinomadura verrucosospora]|uniref:Uncharacterized protein n=1 Tax=Actinomadura verrucosospora TaxID=46165 RepID=A0A7D4AL80_ACTVE|nr:hypothetical protein [Actinomadura verrucosospora]QKG21168.1 hypothetical protein ACTIVE_2806 [Actinomadura verrucosospora]